MSTEAPGHSPSPSAGDPVEMFGPYRLEERIGRGGMGEVYRAFDTSRQRTVAVKRLHGGLADDGDYQERFRRESRTAARLSSPHVIPIHDFGTIDGRLYIDMRLVSGLDLADEIERHGRLDPRRAAEIVRQTADALDAAHDDGLIHRDVKPSNVLITQHRGRDFVYLVDFGIVRAMGGDTKSSLTGTGSAIGTLAYMAPELFLGREMDRRVDVYALGCLLFEAIAGRPPFLSEGPGLMYDHLNETPPRLSEVAPGSPPALDAVLATAMAKDPAQRYATAGDFADAALQAVGGEARTGETSAPGDGTARHGAGGAFAAGAAGRRPRCCGRSRVGPGVVRPAERQPHVRAGTAPELRPAGPAVDAGRPGAGTLAVRHAAGLGTPARRRVRPAARLRHAGLHRRPARVPRRHAGLRAAGLRHRPVPAAPGRPADRVVRPAPAAAQERQGQGHRDRRRHRGGPAARRGGRGRAAQPGLARPRSPSRPRGRPRARRRRPDPPRRRRPRRRPASPRSRRSSRT